MIKFNKITYSNFMAVGTAPVVIHLSKSHTTLITAINGSGKSTFLDAISFVLYGRAYRNITRGQMVNSINQKKCLVEVEFEIGKKTYIVKRGIKPNVFEIWENGKMYNQDPNVRDYQKILETQILKMNYRAFTQVVVMGSSSYIPFMKLKPHERREFIEDLLDIRVFSVMNKLLFQKMKDGKEQLRDTELEIKSTKEKISLQENFINSRKKEKNDASEKIIASIAQAKADIAVEESKIEGKEQEITGVTGGLEQFADVSEKISELSLEHKRFSKLIKEHSENQKFYHTTDTCPTCKQGIGDDHKGHIIGEIDAIIAQYELDMQTVSVARDALNVRIARMDELNEEMSRINLEISKCNQNVHGNNLLIRKYNKELQDLVSDTASIDADRDALKQLAKCVISLTTKRKKMIEDAHYQTIAYGMLLDNGIKSKIIKQYIPVINKLVNKYLNALDFFVLFNLDENFNEVVKSRYRDEFSYDSFSEGEKQRIDLSLVFAWRDVAKMKNSVNTNLVVFDELFDSSLDQAGMDLSINLLYGLKDSNVFVISHRESIADKFVSTVKFTKKNNFTIIDSV
jgi:DNA repair exonuclease SbcCD ATPase subunit